MLFPPDHAGMVSSLSRCLFADSVILSFHVLSVDIQGLSSYLTGKFFGFNVIADYMIFSFALEDWMVGSEQGHVFDILLALAEQMPSITEF